MSTTIAIGILAHNEETDIYKLLSSLAKQSLFDDKKRNVSVFIVANGCTDRTVKVCNDFLKKWDPVQTLNNINQCKVVELEIADKSNAWNVFIHELCIHADIAILMDADIKIKQETNLESLVLLLDDNKNIDVATSLALKVLPQDVSYWFAKLSLFGSSDKKDYSRHSISGSLYAARLAAIRRIWLPRGLPVEDGFIRAMVLTHSFSEPEGLKRIERSNDASHYYEGDLNLRSLIKHQTRIVSGSVFNSILFRYLESLKDSEGNACLILKSNILEDPNLLVKILSDYLSKNRLFIIPLYFYFWRLNRLKYYNSFQKFKRAPILLLGVIFDIIIALNARQIIKDKRVIGYW